MLYALNSSSQKKFCGNTRAKTNPHSKREFIHGLRTVFCLLQSLKKNRTGIMGKMCQKEPRHHHHLHQQATAVAFGQVPWTLPCSRASEASVGQDNIDNILAVAAAAAAAVAAGPGRRNSL